MSANSNHNYTPKVPVINNLEHWLVLACFLSHGFKNYKIFSTAPHIILLTLSCSLARVRGRVRFFSFSILFFPLSSLFFLLVLFFLFLLSLFFLSLSLLFLALVLQWNCSLFWPCLRLYRFNNVLYNSYNQLVWGVLNT